MKNPNLMESQFTAHLGRDRQYSRQTIFLPLYTLKSINRLSSYIIFMRYGWRDAWLFATLVQLFSIQRCSVISTVITPAITPMF